MPPTNGTLPDDHHHDQPDDSSPSLSEAFWEREYQRKDGDGGRRPSPSLRSVMSTLTPRPGRAWELGCGHGDDAVWLARLGWHVVPTDVSTTAVARLRQRSAEAGVAHRVAPQHLDLDDRLPDGTFDLVYGCHFHPGGGIDRDAILRQAIHKVNPGGHLVVIDHGSNAPWSWSQSERPTPAGTLESLTLDPNLFEPMVCERSERAATGPAGETATVLDNVIVVRRRSEPGGKGPDRSRSRRPEMAGPDSRNTSTRIAATGRA